MKRPASELIDEVLQHDYDPAKAHAYYERTKQLKGRQSGNVTPISAKRSGKETSSQGSRNPTKTTHKIPASLQQRVNQLNDRLSTLQARLHEILQTAKKGDSKKSGKKTAADKHKEAQASQKYRDKHKTQIAQKRKQAAAKSGGGSTKTSISSMSESEVRAAIKTTRNNLKNAVAKARAAANRGTA